MIELEGVPELIDPVMVAAFEGWNDAGDAASTAVAHLDREWKGEVFAALDAEDYYDFQVNRPTVWHGRRRAQDHLAHDPALRGAGRTATQAARPGTGPRHRAEHALAFVLQRDPGLRPRVGRRDGGRPGRAARRHPAHPPGPGQRRHLRPGPGPDHEPGGVPLRGAHRHRRHPPGGVHARGRPGGEPVGRGAALRVAAAEPEGDAGAAQPPGGPARTCASRWASCPRTPAPGSSASTSWPPRTARSRSTCSRWRRRGTPPSCRRRRARPSPASSSAICGAGTAGRAVRPAAGAARAEATRASVPAAEARANRRCRLGGARPGTGRRPARGRHETPRRVATRRTAARRTSAPRARAPDGRTAPRRRDGTDRRRGPHRRGQRPGRRRRAGRGRRRSPSDD